MGHAGVRESSGRPRHSLGPPEPRLPIGHRIRSRVERAWIRPFRVPGCPGRGRHDRNASCTEMSASVQTLRYTNTLQAIHWGTAALLLGSYPAAWMIDSAGSGAETAWLLMVHRSCGVTLLLLTALRLCFRQRTRIPPLPIDVPMLLRFTAQACASSLYLLLILQPLLGLAGSMLYGDHIALFGVIILPLLLPANRALGRQVFQMHGLIAVLLLGVIGVHVAAALYHHFVRKDAVLAGMLPGAQRPRRPAAETGKGLPDSGRPIP
jgi:cytochrome b561